VSTRVQVSRAVSARREGSPWSKVTKSASPSVKPKQDIRLFASFAQSIACSYERASIASSICPSPFAEPAQVLATALVVRSEAPREVIEHAPEGPLEYRATLRQR
jgi:hypothetical protein